jgi:hypothetical protein
VWDVLLKPSGMSQPRPSFRLDVTTGTAPATVTQNKTRAPHRPLTNHKRMGRQIDAAEGTASLRVEWGREGLGGNSALTKDKKDHAF